MAALATSMVVVYLRAQSPVGNPPVNSGTSGTTAPAGAPRGNDIELVEKLMVARRDYQKALESLRVHYIQTGDVERAKWAEEELRQYHRIPRQAYRLELDVPPPNLNGLTNVTEANKLFTRAMGYKDKGWGNDYIDNQRRAEILFQELLTKYPQSDKISDAAYMLGDLYESKAYKHHRRAAQYYERCFQWNPRTQHDARIRAARIYDKQLHERPRAMELYREVTTHETDTRRIQEATRRLTELSGSK
jgi:tetratricopeptide (TPR) repeat protein